MMTEEQPPGDRPGWSLTWLFRVQHRRRAHAKEPRPTPPENGKGGTGFQWFSWAVMLILIIEIGVLVYQGFLPR